MTYKINGTATSIGPATVRWMPTVKGNDHNGQPLYSTSYTVELRFSEGASVTDGREWLDGTSSGSVTLTIPTRWGLDFTDLSSVYVQILEPPELADVHLGSFALLVNGVTL